MKALTLRDWQQQALQKFAATKDPDFVCVVTPAAGKTLFAGCTLKRMLEDQKVERVIIVVPSLHLKLQWANQLSPLGIELDPCFKPKDSAMESANYRGVVITYQAMVSGRDALRASCAGRRTLVILDEVHHAASEASWGEAMRVAFELATCRLLLSGTLWSSTGQPIPFVNYGKDGFVESDYAYNFGDAVRDGICRAVQVEHYNGEGSWSTSRMIQRHRLSDMLGDRDRTNLLRAILDPTLDWFKMVITKANQELMGMRRVHPNAGGLVVCKDQSHARATVAVMERLLGYKPMLAISDEPKASDNIKMFKDEYVPWLVTVKMVSEGVDIPRLRVLVYASDIRTELYFRQVVGRVVRAGDDPVRNLMAHVYVPVDREIHEWAAKLEEEGKLALDLRGGAVSSGDVMVSKSGLPVLPDDYEAHGAEGEFAYTTIGGVHYTEEAVVLARELHEMYPSIPLEEHIQVAAKKLGFDPIKRAGPSMPTTEATPTYQLEKSAKADRTAAVRTLAGINVGLRGGGDLGEECKLINREMCKVWNRRAEQLTIDEIRQQVVYLRERIASLRGS